MRRSTPFDTRELDATRQAHREFLATVPVWLFQEIVHHEPSMDASTDSEAERLIVETILRSDIEDRLGEESELVALLRSDAENQGATEYLGNAVSGFGWEVPEVLVEMWESARSRAGQRLSKVTPNQLRWLRGVVWALILADRLANDGYRDSRAPEATSS